jgi:hypothetical protein
MFSNVDSGRSRIFSSDTSHGDCRRCFLAYMVDAPGSTAPAPPREPTVDIFYVDGGCSWISFSTRHGDSYRCFLALMVGAVKSIAPAPPREPNVDVLQLGDSHSQTSANASEGATMSSTFLSKSFLGFLHC